MLVQDEVGGAVQSHSRCAVALLRAEVGRRAADTADTVFFSHPVMRLYMHDERTWAIEQRGTVEAP